ncbi:MAG: hypothetical protein R3F14_31340 [Polyangiaceae bacterium]
MLALTAGAESLGAMIRKAKGARAQKTGIKKAVAAPAPVRRERASVAPLPRPRFDRSP